MSVLESTIVVPANHPCLPGHFPGRPVVPGVVLLDLVCSVWMSCHSPQTLRRIVSAKFTSIVLPEQTLAVRLAASAGGRVRFSCTRGVEVVSKGVLEFS